MNRNDFDESGTTDAETRGQAVQARDASFDGVFVYGVRSTGIYCKPSCPSRRPMRRHIVFFSSVEEAEAGGFRACLRCRPRAATAHDSQAALVRRACRAIEDHADGALSLGDLSEALGVGPHQLHRTFKKITGVTPRQYAAARRLELFKSKVRAGEDLTGAMYAAGYGSSSRLYETAAGRLGMTPATYLRGGDGMSIQYTIVNSHLGRLLVAATARGICAVSFDDDDAQLEASLAAEYPAGELRRDDAHLKRWVEILLNHLDGSHPHLDLPLDVQATAFQLRVWEELRKIPYGATRSYAEIAQAVNQPGATRAVARACAANRVALVTPCHRVIRGDGQLSGYRWGVERKRALLSRERDSTPEDAARAKESGA